MDNDFGDFAALEPVNLALDIPMPTEADQAAFEGVQASAFAADAMATIPDMGASSLPAAMTVEQFTADAFDPPVAQEAMGEGLGALPPVQLDLPPAAADLYAMEEAAPESPPTDVAAFPAPLSDAPAASEAFGAMLGGVPDLALPGPTESPFAGAFLPPEEIFDLQLAVPPPPPAQEGFGAVSDAPQVDGVEAWAREDSRSGPSGFMAAFQEMSATVFGPMASADGGSRSRAGGATVHVENLHLPAAKASDAVAELLALSSGTHFDLGGLA